MIKEVSSENILPKDKLSSIKSKNDEHVKFKTTLGKIVLKNIKNHNADKKNSKTKSKQKSADISGLISKKIEKKSEDKEKRVINIDFAVIENNIKSLKAENKKNAKTEDADKVDAKTKENAISTKSAIKTETKIKVAVWTQIKENKKIDEHIDSKDEKNQFSLKNAKQTDLKENQKTQDVSDKKTNTVLSKDGRVIQTKNISANKSDNLIESKPQNTRAIDKKSDTEQINKVEEKENKIVVDKSINNGNDKKIKNRTEKQQTLKAEVEPNEKNQNTKTIGIKTANKEDIKSAPIEKITIEQESNKEHKTRKISDKETEKPKITANTKENKTLKKEIVKSEKIEETIVKQEKPTLRKQENSKQQIGFDKKTVSTQKEKPIETGAAIKETKDNEKISDRAALNDKPNIKLTKTDKQTIISDIQSANKQEETHQTEEKRNSKQTDFLHKSDKNTQKADIDKQTKDIKNDFRDKKQTRNTLKVDTIDRKMIIKHAKIQEGNEIADQSKEFKKEHVETVKTQAVKITKNDSSISKKLETDGKQTNRQEQIDNRIAFKQNEQKTQTIKNTQDATIENKNQIKQESTIQNTTNIDPKVNVNKTDSKHAFNNGKIHATDRVEVKQGIDTQNTIQNVENQTKDLKNPVNIEHVVVQNIGDNPKLKEHKKDAASVKSQTKKTSKGESSIVHVFKGVEKHSENLHLKENPNTVFKQNKQNNNPQMRTTQEEKQNIKLEISEGIKVSNKDTKTKDAQLSSDDRLDLQIDKTSQNTIAGITNMQNQQTTSIKDSNIPYPLDKVVEHIEHVRNIMKPPFDNSVTIKLNPPGLGLMEIRVKMDKDKHLTTTINADNREVFKIINAHADKLKDYLVSQGFKVENVSIQNGLQEHGSFGQNAQNGFGNSQNQAQTNQRSQYYFSNNVRDDVKSETEQINRQISKNGLDITV